MMNNDECRMYSEEAFSCLSVDLVLTTGIS